MIKIPTKGIESNKSIFLKDILNRYIAFLNDKKISDPTNYGIICTYLSDSSGNISKDKVKELICGKLSTLVGITNDLLLLYNNAGLKLHESLDGLIELYSNFSIRKLAYTWPEIIGVSVCPYCNRNYIFTVPRKKVRPQYDHYFPKSLYPHLCVSMYNLIPCCGMCNSFKSDDDPLANKIIYPYAQGFDYDVFFSAYSSGKLLTDILDLNKRIYVEIISPNESGLPFSLAYSKTNLKLSDLYKKHNDLVEDIRRLSLIYKKDYIESLAANYYWIKNSNEALDLLFLNRIQKDDWHKRPLSKMTHDLLEQFLS